MNELIEHKIERLAQVQPLDPDEVDYTISNPSVLGKALGRTFAYFGRVEQEITGYNLDILLPDSPDDYAGRFRQIWEAQEIPHGIIFENIQKALGLVPEPLPESEPATNAHKLAGALGKVSTGLHEVVEMVWLGRGAMHEQLTLSGYHRLGERLIDIGETALYHTAIKPIKPQEGGHSDFYSTAGGMLSARLRPWQKRAVKAISLKTYAPVGVHNFSQSADFGHIAEILADGKDKIANFVDPIQRVAQNLLALGGEVLPPFVYKSIMECVEAEEERLASAA